jgi:hypothetical protein
LQDDDEAPSRPHDASPRLEEVRDGIWIRRIDFDPIREQWFSQRFRRHAGFRVTGAWRRITK